MTYLYIETQNQYMCSTELINTNVLSGKPCFCLNY